MDSFRNNVLKMTERNSWEVDQALPVIARTTMVAPYRGEELSLQESFRAFSCKLKEVTADPNKYVAQGTL